MRTNQKEGSRWVCFLSIQEFATRLTGVILLTVLFAMGNSSSAQPQRAMGLDVSYWNRGSSSAAFTGITQTGWNTAFSTPNANGFTRQFVWIRATRGGTTGLSQTSGTPSPGGTNETQSARYDDPEFLRTVTRSTTAGLFAGAYHFGRPDVMGNTGTDEADHFIEYAGAYLRPGYLMPIYDLEAGSGGDALAQFAIDFSNRLFQRMQIRPAVYLNGNYSSILQGATLARRDQLAKPVGPLPSVVGPAYPMVWNARYSDNANPEAIPVQTGGPKTTFTTLSTYYGPWDDYGNLDPWSFWQYASTVSIPGINTIDSGVDGNVSHGDIEYVKNYLVPAIWWNDASGDWGSLTNWNCGQPLSVFNVNNINNPRAPYIPHVGAGQTTPFFEYTHPSPRLPGTAGNGPSPTSGAHDTVILERPNANITVTLSGGAYHIRKLYVRETLHIVGGSLTINYNPTYRANNSVDVLHAGPIAAQFSGSVTLSNSGALSVHTLQVDTNRVFTLAGGTLTFNTINLMPHASTPAKVLVNGDVNFNALANATALVMKGAGAGSSGLVDLSGHIRAFSVGNGASDVDLSLDVPVTNGGLTKSGAGTLRLTAQNTYGGGTTLSAGRLFVNNTIGTGTGSGAVDVNGGVLGGTGTIAGVVTVNSGGTLSPGTSIGTLTLNNSPVFSGTNFMEINRNGGAPLADRIVLTSGTLNYGGTLVVSNAGPALTGGEVFTLFSAPAYSGAFANPMLPGLSAGLNWFTDGLIANGSIKVNRKPATTPLWFTNVAPVIEIPFATLTGNATDADADALSLVGVDATTTNGSTLTTNGTAITYSNLVSGIDQFSYTISDGHGGTASGSVNVVNVTASPSAEFVGVPNVSGGSVSLNFSAVPGGTYYLERSTNLLVWKTIWTNVAPASGVFDYTDNFNDLVEPPPSAFYQLRWEQ